jgi:hypothetical protein
MFSMAEMVTSAFVVLFGRRAERRDMQRRQFLGFTCGVCVSTAGCLGFGGTNKTVGVAVRNQDSAARKITAQVRFDGEVLLDETTTVDPGETVNTSFENPNSAGEAAVTATSASGPETSKHVRVGPGTGIRSITIRAREGGSLRIVATRT